MSKRKYHHYTYLTTDLTNNMKYFGVRSSELPPNLDTKYLGSGKILLARIKAEGRENFKKEVLEVFETRDDANQYEEWYITMHDCVDNEEYYNISARSTGGRFDYHEDLKDGLTSSPQAINGLQKEVKPKEVDAENPEIPVVVKENIQVETEVAKHPYQMDAKEEFISSLPGIPEPPKPLEKKEEVTGRTHEGKPDGRIYHKGQMGGPRKGAGRPKGKHSLISKESVERLRAGLSFIIISSLIYLQQIQYTELH